jgi:O-antigen/teichoic acid export membrane protein
MSLPGEPSDGPVEPEAPQSLTGTVIRGAGLSASGYAVAQLLTFGVYVALARLLEPSDFGDFAAATVLIGFTLLITESGMSSAIIQRRDRVEEAASTAVVATVIGGITFSLVMLAAAPLIGAFFDSSDVTAIAAAMSGVIVLRSITGVPDGLLIRRFSFVRRLVVEPVQVVVFGIAAVWAAARGLGAWALVIGQYASFTTEAVLIWVLVRWRPKLRLASFEMWKELIRYGRHILAATTVLRIGEQSDTVIVGRFLGAAPLGQFRYAFRIASTPFAMLLAGASYVLFPAFARIAHDRQRLEAAFERSLHWMCVLAFPAGLILLPLGEPLTVILLGDVWRSAGYAAMAMCAYTAGGAITSVVSEALKAHGRPDPLTKMHTVATLLTAASMLALVPLGLSAVAAGFSVGALGGAAYSVRVVHRVLGVEVAAMTRQIWPPAAAAVIMAAAVFAAEWLLIDAESHGTALGVVLLGVEGLIGTATFISALAIVAPSTARELLAGIRAGIARAARLARRTPERTQAEHP